jgi:hypothetical protein
MKRESSDSPLFDYYHSVSQMIAMKEKGFTLQQIATHFKTTKRKISYHIKEFDRKFYDERKK